MKTYFFVLLAAFSLANFVAADSNTLDEMLNTARIEHEYPALAAAIIRNGILVENSTVGIRKWGDTTPVEATDAFHLGSCTKAMTATLIAMLIEEGKLKWDATLGELFVDFRDEMHPDYRKVTVDQLLAHRGGCPHETWPKGKTFDDIHDLPGAVRERRAQYVAMILRQPPEAEPGTRYIYSNAGYTTLGAITERVTGTPWEQLMQERLFEPLQLTTAGFGPMGAPGKIDQPWQHTMVKGKPNPIPPEPRNDNPPAIAPSGQVHCSIQDWATYIMAFMKDRCDGGLLQADTRKYLLTPQFGGAYAGGWGQVEAASDDGPVFRHTGSNTMNFCFAVMIPERHAAVLIATNRGGDLNALARECGMLANKLFEKYPVTH